MIVTIRDDTLVVEEAPSMPGDASGTLALIIALTWAMGRIADEAARATEAAALEQPTVH